MGCTSSSENVASMSQASSRPNEEKPKSSQLPQEFVPKPIGDAISPRDPDIKLEAPPEMIQAQEVTPGLMKLESSPQVKQVPGLIKLEEGKQEPSLINLKAPPQVKQDVVRDVRPILTLDSSKEPPIVNIDEVAPSLSHDSLVFSLPQPDIESDDDGSELSRDSFEGNIVTNTPSPAIIRNDESSVASSSHGLNKSINPDKVHIISSKEEFIYEYERWQPFVQWGQTKPGHMLPSDPGIYSDLEGTKFGYNTDDVAPSHPKWWTVISPFEPVSKDEDPWEYSVDFRNYEWHPNKQKKTFVRRRKLRRLVGDSRHHQSPLSHGITSFSSSRHDLRPPPATVKGNMKKSGGKLQSFNDRYFVLESTAEGSFLIYYLKYTDSPPFGTNERDRMNLKHCQMDISSEGHVILTSRRGKTYVLDLQDHPDQEKWIQSLQDHINYASHSEPAK